MAQRNCATKGVFMRTKKLSASAIAVIVLSVLLIVSVTAGATFAWFASQDNAAGSFLLGEPVVVSVTQADTTDTETLSMVIASENLLPGMLITPDIAVTLDASTTATVLRARIVTTVTGTITGNLADLNTAFNTQLTGVVSGGWVLNTDDGWYYFLGASGLDSRVMLTPAETSALVTPEFGNTVADYDVAVVGGRAWEATAGDTVLASVVSGATTKTVPFLTTPFRLPDTITNDFADAQINIDFDVQALQDYVVVGDVNVLPTRDNVKTIMDTLLV